MHNRVRTFVSVYLSQRVSNDYYKELLQLFLRAFTFRYIFKALLAKRKGIARSLKKLFPKDSMIIDIADNVSITTSTYLHK